MKKETLLTIANLIGKQEIVLMDKNCSGGRRFQTSSEVRAFVVIKQQKSPDTDTLFLLTQSKTFYDIGDIGYEYYFHQFNEKADLVNSNPSDIIYHATVVVRKSGPNVSIDDLLVILLTYLQDNGIAVTVDNCIENCVIENASYKSNTNKPFQNVNSNVDFFSMHTPPEHFMPPMGPGIFNSMPPMGLDVFNRPLPQFHNFNHPGQNYMHDGSSFYRSTEPDLNPRPPQAEAQKQQADNKDLNYQVLANLVISLSQKISDLQ